MSYKKWIALFVFLLGGYESVGKMFTVNGDVHIEAEGTTLARFEIRYTPPNLSPGAVGSASAKPQGVVSAENGVVVAPVPAAPPPHGGHWETIFPKGGGRSR